MFQVTFSDQSLGVLNSLSQVEQLNLMDKLGSLSSDIINENSESIGRFTRNGKVFHRIRLGELRVYFEQADIALHCHYILPKNSLNDFFFDVNALLESAILENHGSFWEYLSLFQKLIVCEQFLFSLLTNKFYSCFSKIFFVVHVLPTIFFP